MTNKKKHGRQTKKQQSEDTANKGTEVGPSLPSQQSNSSRKNFTNPQLTCLIIVVVGASKLWEWRRALLEVTELAASDTSLNDAANATANSVSETLCASYMLTNTEKGVDYDNVCSAPETATMMTLKYNYSLQMLALVVYTMLKCWHRDDLLNRFNGFLSVAPISTTLLLLQACAPYLARRPSKMLTIMCAVLMGLASSGTSSTLREMAQGRLMAPSRRAASIQSLCLSSMICLNLYETWQWFQTSTAGSSPILVLTTEWNDAWKVFLYTLMMDKFTISLLLTFVWLCFEEHRQRSVLLVFAVLKGFECAVQLSDYDEANFVDLSSMRTTAVTCAVFSGIAWMAPNLHLASDIPSAPVNNKSTKVE